MALNGFARTWKVAFALCLALASPRAFADPSVCAKLLVHAETETPEVVEATVFHLLTVDYPIILEASADFYMLHTVANTFRHLIDGVTYSDASYWHLWGIGPRIRDGESIKSYEISEISGKMWNALRNFYSVSPTPDLRFFAWNAEAKKFNTPFAPEKLVEISTVLATIEGNPALLQAAKKVISQILLNCDELGPDAGEFRNGLFGKKTYRYRDRKKWIDKFSAQIGAKPVPAPMPIDWRVDAERISDPHLSEINAAFAKPNDATTLRSPDGIFQYEAESRKNAYDLNLSAVACRDEFTGLLSWPYFFDAAGKWLLEWGTTKESAKLHFLDRLTRMRKHLDDHLLVARSHLHATAMGEKAILDRIRDLENAIPSDAAGRLEDGIAISLNAERQRTKGRLEASLAEVRALGNSMRAWIDRLDEADGNFRDLAALAPAGGLPPKDPDALRSRMKSLQTTLDLDENLFERLKTKRFWLLPAK